MDGKTLCKEIPELLGYFKALCESFSGIFEFVYPFRNADAELMEQKKKVKIYVRSFSHRCTLYLILKIFPVCIDISFPFFQT